MKKLRNLLIATLLVFSSNAWASDNYHTDLTTGASATVSSINTPMGTLDNAITYLKNIIVSPSGAVYYTNGTLYWSGTITIYFTDSLGKNKKNNISAANVALSDNYFAYVTLSETENATITVSSAAMSTNGAENSSNTEAYNRLVLGYRNTTTDDYNPVYLPLSKRSERQITVTGSTNPLSILYSTYRVNADATTQTLPSAANITGMRFTIIQVAAYTSGTTIASTSSQTINGNTPSTYNLTAQYKYITVESDGSNWFLVDSN